MRSEADAAESMGEWGNPNADCTLVDNFGMTVQQVRDFDPQTLNVIRAYSFGPAPEAVRDPGRNQTPQKPMGCGSRSGEEGETSNRKPAKNAKEIAGAYYANSL